MVTADSVRDAGIAAHLAVDPAVLPEPSIYFQDFNFGGTMFDALFGNAEALSGVGEGVADVATNSRINQETNGKKSTDLALDVQDMIDAEEARRAEIIKLGELNMTRGEIEDILKVLNDPEQRERASQDYAARNNVSIEEGRSEMDWMHRIISLADKQANRTITPAEQAELDRETSQPGFDGRFQKARDSLDNVANDADISLANNAARIANASSDVAVEAATTGTVIEQDAVVGQIVDETTQQEALSRRGYASTQVDELVGRQADSGDELSALFGEAANGPQLAVADISDPATSREMTASLAPMQG